MAYKNSGAMKFNDATDLVIRADPDGTVESVFNKADQKEYLDNPFSPPENYTITIKNEASASRSLYWVRLEAAGYLAAPQAAVGPGQTMTIEAFRHTSISHTAGSIEVESGDISEITTSRTLVDSSGTFKFVD